MNYKTKLFFIKFIPVHSWRHNLRHKVKDAYNKNMNITEQPVVAEQAPVVEQHVVQPQPDRLDKYQGYKPASNGCEMQQFVDWVNNFSTLVVKNIFEIGANFAQDAEYLALKFGVEPENVYVFEAHPDIYRAITKIHKFNAYNYAVFNKNTELTFNILPITESNTGLSSILTRNDKNTVPITLPAIRMDAFMNEHNISKIDFLKLDVEGCNWEVLDGFGDRLKDINAIHVEAEHQPIYNEGKHFFEDIKELLLANNFEMVYFQRSITQSDSFWIQKKFLKKIIIK